MAKGYIGDFRRPPKGPKIGAEKTIEQLDPEHQAELGDLSSIKPEQPAAEASAAGAQDTDAPDETLDIPPLAQGVTEPGDEVESLADQLNALQAVMEREPQEDPEVVAARPDDRDKEAFMRSILGNTAYTKEYSLFGGMVVVELQDLMPQQEDRIYAQLAMDQAAERIKTQEDWELMLQRYRAVFGIKRLLSAGKPVYVRESDADKEKLCGDIYELANDHVRERFVSSTVYRAVMRVVRIFRQHLNQLFEGALNSDFWEVDGSVSPSRPTSEEPSTTQTDPDSAPGS